MGGLKKQRPKIDSQVLSEDQMERLAVVEYEMDAKPEYEGTLGLVVFSLLAFMSGFFLSNRDAFGFKFSTRDMVLLFCFRCLVCFHWLDWLV